MELKGKSSLFAFICVLLYIAGSLTYSGQSSSIHGSFIIVAKVNDGIMMASDSRCSFPYINSKGIRSELAYIDNFQKIYIVGKNAIAVSGNFSIDNLFVSTMLEEFKKTNNDDKLNIKGLLPAFFQFCKKHYSNYFYSKLVQETTLFAAGLDTAKIPRIYVSAASYGRIQEQVGNPPVAETDVSLFVPAFNQNMNCQQAGAIAEKSIKGYAETHGLTDKIGGKIIIAKISSTGVDFIKDRPVQMQYKYVKDLINDITNGKIVPTFTSTANKLLFFKLYTVK